MLALLELIDHPKGIGTVPTLEAHIKMFLHVGGGKQIGRGNSCQGPAQNIPSIMPIVHPLDPTIGNVGGYGIGRDSIFPTVPPL